MNLMQLPAFSQLRGILTTEPCARQRILLLLLVGCGVYFFAMGLMILFGAYRKYSNDSASWPKAEGIIIKSQLRVGRVRGIPNYEPEIEYQYQVNGQAHTGS